MTAMDDKWRPIRWIGNRVDERGPHNRRATKFRGGTITKTSAGGAVVASDID